MNEEINKIINWIEISYTRLNYKEELLLVNYIKQLQQENQSLKDRIEKANNKLREHKHDLDYEPWSIYEINGSILFDLVDLLKGDK